MNKQSRREFIATSGSAVGGSWLSLHWPVVLAAAQVACARRDESAAWQNLSAEEAAGFAAIADQIIPPDETPGAAELGVVYFLDEALNGFMQGAGPMLKQGLVELDENSMAKQPGVSAFVDLAFDEQTLLLESIERSPMFQTMLMITQAGMFALPEYGGNRDHGGWELIGFKQQHTWQAPFGHYDEGYSAGEPEHAES